MILLTHPNNAKHINSLTVKAENNLPSGTRLLRGIEVRYDDLIPELTPSKTEFIPVEDKFVEYSSTNPSDWEVYFGFVKPKMVSHYIMWEETKAFFYTGKGIKSVEQRAKPCGS